MVEELHKLLGHQLRTGYEIQSGEGTSAPAVIFADADYEVGDGSTGLHETQKPANEPAIVYLRADAAIATMPAPMSVAEAARVLLEAMPNYAMERAAIESRANDDEGEFAPLGDLLDFSGQNKTHTVVREALNAALRAAMSIGDADG